MLTSDDGRRDGTNVSYLNNPKKWRQFDPQLFDSLHRAMMEDAHRCIFRAIELDIIPGATFYTDVLKRSIAERGLYFERCLQMMRDRDVIFFDPDNGLEVASTPIGKPGSTKFLYLNELESAYERGHSVLLYQHFSRQKRDSFIDEKGIVIGQRLKASVKAFRSGNVVFFLCAQRRHEALLDESSGVIRKKWAGQIEVV